jgi:hypothetical protein
MVKAAAADSSSGGLSKQLGTRRAPLALGGWVGTRCRVQTVVRGDSSHSGAPGVGDGAGRARGRAGGGGEALLAACVVAHARLALVAAAAAAAALPVRADRQQQEDAAGNLFNWGSAAGHRGFEWAHGRLLVKSEGGRVANSSRRRALPQHPSAARRKQRPTGASAETRRARLGHRTVMIAPAAAVRMHCCGWPTVKMSTSSLDWRGGWQG